MYEMFSVEKEKSHPNKYFERYHTLF